MLITTLKCMILGYMTYIVSEPTSNNNLYNKNYTNIIYL